MTIDEIQTADAAKYENKRTGLTCDEALEAAVMGYRVRSPSIPAGAYIHYNFKGWRIQFLLNGEEGSSSNWTPDTSHFNEEWSIVPLPSEVKRDSWGRPIDEPAVGKWGKQ